MKYYYDLYMSEELTNQKSEIIEKIESNKWQIEKYLIVLARHPENHLEYFNSVLLNQKAMEKDDLFVVGIANGIQGALELVEKITQEVYDKTRNADIKSYILQKQCDYEEGNV